MPLSLEDLRPQRVPEPQHNFEDAEKVAKQLEPEVKQNLEYLKRGDLGVPDHALRVAAYQYASQCNEVNKEYLLCKDEEGDPRRCLKYGDKVSVCAENFFRTVTEKCKDEFVKAAQCCERTSTRRMMYCRTEQQAFDTCLFEKLGFDKLPHAGHRIGATVKTDRPKPVNPYNFEGPLIDSRRQPAPDFFERPVGQTRD